MKQTLLAIKTVLSKKWYLFSFLALVPLVFLFFVYIPVRSIPGNSLEFQLGIFSHRDYTTLTIFSLLTSLFLIMQAFIFRNSLNSKDKLVSLGKGGIGGYVAIIGSIFGTASCSSCLAALFGFLGFNTLLFLVERQWYIVSGAIILLLISLYFVSKKINGICDICRVNPENHKAI